MSTLNGSLPPGPRMPVALQTALWARGAQWMLAQCARRFDETFSMRIFHGNSVFMIGPEANHYMTVSHAQGFSWREGHMGDLIPFLGDGLLTIDGEYHRRSRRIMLPAFHREAIGAALGTMNAEIDRALDGWRMAWTRALEHAHEQGRALATWEPINARADFVRRANRLAAAKRAEATRMSCDDPKMWDLAELALRFEDEARLVEYDADCLIARTRKNST